MVKLNWIEFENSTSGLKCERIYFNEYINLLVGLSGAGKTQIVKAIEKSLKYAIYKIDLHPFYAKMCFIVDDREYIWEYSISAISERKPYNLLSIKYVFTYERLKLNGEDVLLRDGDKIKLKDFDSLPTPLNNQSILSQYGNDPVYKNIIEDFRRIMPIDINYEMNRNIDKKCFNKFKNQVSGKKYTYHYLIISELPTICKLYLAKIGFYDNAYNIILNYVQSIFPEVTDINIVEDQSKGLCVLSLNSLYGCKNDYCLTQNEISSGMLKAIYLIIELVTAQPDSLILIDEFENGLGANCLGCLLSLLSSNLQFVITSHHPKVMSQIPPVQWYILNRDASTIKNFSADEIGITNSRHEAYFNLLNKWEYEGKI